ncbi:ABC transporter ATP-binding protein [bacterium SCN 62-11]|nr:ABC transporter ATP-binding protein [Candidatus Eremiobacteraeota bacterium]ODT59880.1 MAG: ABC transporter ATP-binding protein [bacterium SCN 62-11]
MEVLKVAGLTKTYSQKTAVDQVSFQVQRGEIVGLLGPNGAGKTTTINMILGVLAPTSGTIHIGGIDLARERTRALSRTNFAAVYAPLPGNLTVMQNLRIAGLLYKVPQLAHRIEEVVEQFELDRYRKTRCGLLSSGEQTRVSLAKAVLNRPDLLLLDEPTASLDPATARRLRRQLKEVDAGGILWTSHNMLEVEDVCDRLLLMAGGKILLEGDPKTLPAEHGAKNLEELFIEVSQR